MLFLVIDHRVFHQATPPGLRIACSEFLSQHVLITDEGVRLYPVQIRYAWLSELDLMAKLAGLELRHRWGGWDRGAFTANSGRHISVYGLPG